MVGKEELRIVHVAGAKSKGVPIALARHVVVVVAARAIPIQVCPRQGKPSKRTRSNRSVKNILACICLAKIPADALPRISHAKRSPPEREIVPEIKAKFQLVIGISKVTSVIPVINIAVGSCNILGDISPVGSGGHVVQFIVADERAQIHWTDGGDHVVKVNPE